MTRDDIEMIEKLGFGVTNIEAGQGEMLVWIIDRRQGNSYELRCKDLMTGAVAFVKDPESFRWKHPTACIFMGCVDKASPAGDYDTLGGR